MKLKHSAKPDFLYRLNTEANLQAEFYMACRQAGLNVVLNLYTPFGFLDAACLSKGSKRLLGIVEVKHGPHKPNHFTKQMERYRATGVCVQMLWRERDIPDVLAKAFKGPGKSLDELARVAPRIKRTEGKKYGGGKAVIVRELSALLEDELNVRP